MSNILVTRRILHLHGSALFTILLKSWKTIIKRHALNTTIHPPCWMYFKYRWHFLRNNCPMQTWFIYARCQKNSYALFWSKFGRTETIKTKKQKEKENNSFFFLQFFTYFKTSCLKIQLKGKSQFLLKIYCQKQAAMEKKLWKKHLFTLDT